MTTENMEVRAVAAVMILAVRKSRGGEVRSVSAVENSEAITFNWSGFDYYFLIIIVIIIIIVFWEGLDFNFFEYC